jgi:hypothetical protein
MKSSRRFDNLRGFVEVKARRLKRFKSWETRREVEVTERWRRFSAWANACHAVRAQETLLHAMHELHAPPRCSSREGNAASLRD